MRSLIWQESFLAGQRAGVGICLGGPRRQSHCDNQHSVPFLNSANLHWVANFVTYRKTSLCEAESHAHSLASSTKAGRRVLFDRDPSSKKFPGDHWPEEHVIYPVTSSLRTRLTSKVYGEKFRITCIRPQGRDALFCKTRRAA